MEAPKLNLDEYTRYLLTAVVILLAVLWATSLDPRLVQAITEACKDHSTVTGILLLLVGYPCYAFYRTCLYDVWIISLKDRLSKAANYRTIISKVVTDVARPVVYDGVELTLPLSVSGPDAERLYHLFPEQENSPVAKLTPITTGIHLGYWLSFVLFVSSLARLALGGWYAWTGHANMLVESGLSISGCATAIFLFWIAYRIDWHYERSYTLAFLNRIEEFKKWFIDAIVQQSNE